MIERARPTNETRALVKSFGALAVAKAIEFRLEGLAPVIVDALLAGLDRLKREEGLALLLVEQHARIALELTLQAIVFHRGAIVFTGPSRQLLAAPDRLDALMVVAARGRQD